MTTETTDNANDPQLNERVKVIEDKVRILDQLTPFLAKAKSYAPKAAWTTAGSVCALIVSLYYINNNIVSFVATGTTKLEHLEKTTDEIKDDVKDQGGDDKETRKMMSDVRVEVGRHGDRLDRIATLVEANQKDVSQIIKTTEATQRDVASLRESVAEIAKAVKDRPIKMAEAEVSMQLRTVIETTARVMQRQLDHRFDTRTLVLDLTRDDVELKPASSANLVAFSVKSTYDKRDLDAELADIKAGSQDQFRFEEGSPYDGPRVVGIAICGPPLSIEVRATDSSGQSRLDKLRKALSSEEATHLKFSVSLPMKPRS